MKKNLTKMQYHVMDSLDQLFKLSEFDYHSINEIMMFLKNKYPSELYKENSIQRCVDRLKSHGYIDEKFPSFIFPVCKYKLSFFGQIEFKAIQKKEKIKNHLERISFDLIEIKNQIFNSINEIEKSLIEIQTSN